MITKMASKQLSVTFNNGVVCPSFGLGTFNGLQKGIGEAVEFAIRAGYRLIDCAYVYQNEDEIGETLQKLYKEGVVKREDLFLTTKLSIFYMATKEDIIECFETSLKNLQTDYIDLYLIHAPFPLRKGASFENVAPNDIIDYTPALISNVWKAMEEFVSKGQARSIGISNFSITKIEYLLKTAKIVPAINQVECHLYFQQKKLQAYCKSKGIAFEAYAPLGSHALVKPPDPVVLDDPVVQEIATKHNATPAQICIAFLLHLGMVVIPKSVKESRIIENLKSTEIVLSPDEIERLKDVDKNCRLFKYKHLSRASLWDEDQDDEYKL